MIIEGRRPRLVAGNWKMNLTETWSVALADELLASLSPLAGRIDVAVAPSFPCLRAVADRLRGSAIDLAAQDLHWEEKGAFTGEVSARMLAELGVRRVIVGHSERRMLFGETDDRVRRKVAAAVRHGIAPIVCVGEQELERDEGRTLEVVERQLRLGLAGLRREEAMSGLCLAYEPVWAIGTGRNATPEQVHEVHRMLREQLASMYGADTAQRIRILYGGSVAPENVSRLARLEEVDGALVGGASIDSARFTAIVQVASGS